MTDYDTEGQVCKK